MKLNFKTQKETTEVKKEEVSTEIEINSFEDILKLNGKEFKSPWPCGDDVPDEKIIENLNNLWTQMSIDTKTAIIDSWNSKDFHIWYRQCRVYTDGKENILLCIIFNHGYISFTCYKVKAVTSWNKIEK